MLRNVYYTMTMPLVCYTAVLSVVTQRSSPGEERFVPRGGALRDDTKNGCVADYHSIGFKAIYLTFLK